MPSDLGDRRIKIGTEENELTQLCKFHDYDFRKYKGKQSVQKIGRNLVDYESGKTIFDTARGIIVNKQNTNQSKLF